MNDATKLMLETFWGYWPFVAVLILLSIGASSAVWKVRR